MRALIVDDEPAARARLRRILRAHADVSVVAECADAAQALAVLQRSAIDVLFADIQMPGPSGLDLVASLPDPAPAVVFVTAYSQYALDAFDAAAADYLVKPVDAGRLDRTLERVRQLLASPGERPQFPVPPSLLVEDRREIIVVPLDRIQWLQAADNYVSVHSDGKSLLLRRTLSGLLRDLGPSFVRVHRSAAVALHAVARVSRHPSGDAMVILAGEVEVPCSRAYRSDLLQRLGELHAALPGLP